MIVFIKAPAFGTLQIYKVLIL